MAEEKKGEMTVEEAGRLGGHKGGEKVKEKYGPEFYSKIGHKGGQKVKELIEKGVAAERK
jgi:general stress protein YciG